MIILYLSKSKLLITLLITIVILAMLLILLIDYKNLKASNDCLESYSNSIRLTMPLEPTTPKNIESSPIYDIPLPSKIFPIQEVVKKGKNIPVDFAFNDPDWIRPAYKTYWHSSVSGGRWSYVPRRINYSLHKIFTSYQTASIYYDFTHELGIWEESKFFDLENGLNNIALVVMDSNIKKIITYGNQVVVIPEPKRTGLQVVEIHDSKIHPIDDDSPIMFQLVTPDGYELDYSLMHKDPR